MNLRGQGKREALRDGKEYHEKYCMTFLKNK